jgi:hypothetical protein
MYRISLLGLFSLLPLTLLPHTDLTVTSAQDGNFQVGYASNLERGDAVVTLTNTGIRRRERSDPRSQLTRWACHRGVGALDNSFSSDEHVSRSHYRHAFPQFPHLARASLESS